MYTHPGKLPCKYIIHTVGTPSPFYHSLLPFPSPSLPTSHCAVVVVVVVAVVRVRSDVARRSVGRNAVPGSGHHSHARSGAITEVCVTHNSRHFVRHFRVPQRALCQNHCRRRLGVGGEEQKQWSQGTWCLAGRSAFSCVFILFYYFYK
jgi:hypothetical protein